MAQIDILDPPHLRMFKRIWMVRTNPEIQVGPFETAEAAGAWASEWFDGSEKRILVLPVISIADATASMAVALRYKQQDPEEFE